MNNRLKILFLLISIHTYTFASNDITNGKINIYYATTDTRNLFNSESSFFDIYFNLHKSYEFNNLLKSNIGISFISSLGLENGLADNSWISHYNNNSNQPKDIVWIDIVNLEYSIFNESSITLGRQKLNTPLLQTETWNIAMNTFDALKINIKEFEYFDTNIIFITRGNGNVAETVQPTNLLEAGMRGFGTQNNKSIFIIGGSSVPIKYSTFDFWFYSMPNNFSAYWLEGNRNNDDLEVGFQLAQLLPKNDKNVLGIGLKVNFYFDEAISVMIAYSRVQNRNSKKYNISNLAGDLYGGGNSNLYTEAFWNIGFVGREGAKSYKVESNIELRLMDIKVGIIGVDGNQNNDDLNEFYVESSMEYDIFDIKLSLINSKAGSTKENRLMAQFIIPFDV